ncbi:MAG: hypothetical protein JOZ41_15470 [Chloroflexi bacterium]|nr:hypothetical protein [Chloroflexota bacterium]
MTERVGPGEAGEDRSIRAQLQRAVRDLWSMVDALGDDYVVFLDRRRLKTCVRQRSDGRFEVSWEEEDGSWTIHDRSFENPREAAFHGYQGPH